MQTGILLIKMTNLFNSRTTKRLQPFFISFSDLFGTTGRPSMMPQCQIVVGGNIPNRVLRWKKKLWRRRPTTAVEKLTLSSLAKDTKFPSVQSVLRIECLLQSAVITPRVSCGLDDNRKGLSIHASNFNRNDTG